MRISDWSSDVCSSDLPDAIVKCPRRGRGILEVKTADWLVAKGWGDEPPLNYLLQIVSYMGLADCDWGDVIVLVGGNELRRLEYEFRPVIYADIEARVEAFWQSIRKGKRTEEGRGGEEGGRRCRCRGEAMKEKKKKTKRK